MKQHHTSKAANDYLRTRVMTATPEQLQVMLYDGALRFCEHAKSAILAGQIEPTHVAIVRAQQIVTELISSMRPQSNPTLCGRLVAVHRFIYKLLMDAGFKRDAGPLDQAMLLLKFQRETWVLLQEQTGRTRADTAPRQRIAPVAHERLSMSA